MVRQSAEVENDMNGVERILHYAQHVEQEAPYEIPDKEPPKSWPAQGEVELKDVVMSYRPGLPAVLQGLSLRINGGEKIGIVGRTGAGKVRNFLEMSVGGMADFFVAELYYGCVVPHGRTHFWFYFPRRGRYQSDWTAYT